MYVLLLHAIDTREDMLTITERCSPHSFALSSEANRASVSEHTLARLPSVSLWHAINTREDMLTVTELLEGQVVLLEQSE